MPPDEEAEDSAYADPVAADSVNTTERYLREQAQGNVRVPVLRDVYRRYLDVTLDHPAVKALITFGLSDRYTWLQEDLPREDGAARRPLPFDEDLKPKPAYHALAHSLRDAPWRRPLWPIRR